MNIARLHEMLPNAPQWFWECPQCQSQHKHILNWIEGAKRMEVPLWEAVSPFLSRYHFELSHQLFPDDIAGRPIDPALIWKLEKEQAQKERVKRYLEAE